MKYMVIHIGYPKTGTTSLKETLRKYVNHFYYINDEFPKDRSQKRIRYLSDEVFIFKKNNKLNLLIDTIIKTCQNSNYDNFFFSIEDVMNFENFSEEISFSNLSKIVNDVSKNFNIALLMTIRSQRDMFISNFSYSFHKYYGKDINKLIKKLDDRKIIIKNLDFFHKYNLLKAISNNIFILPLEYVQFPDIYKKTFSSIFLLKEKEFKIYKLNSSTIDDNKIKINDSLIFNYLIRFHLLLKKYLLFYNEISMIPRKYLRNYYDSKKNRIVEIEDLNKKKLFKIFIDSNKLLFKTSDISPKISKSYF
tara:strand:- start:1049 stop:1966 length:918 start_codon:yes stop_codon:yes gene_type:complete